jgi:TM2 domain-containing membrane protein YozV
MYKIIGADGKEYAAANAEQLKQWVAEGRANAQTPVQIPGETEWRYLADFGILATGPTPTVPPVQTYVTRPAGADKKIVAGIVALIPHTGMLGIHKFVQGNTGAGVARLLITVLTCGIGGAVMWIISLIEGLIYLTMSDEEFVRTYILNKKGWF